MTETPVYGHTESGPPINDAVTDELAAEAEVNRPGVRGDFWPWKTKEEVHAERSRSWEADDASVFA